MADQESRGSLYQRASLHRVVRCSLLVAVLLSTALAEGVTVSPPSCTAIQNAINALPSGGGEVTLEAGTYTCRAPIVINRNNVSLRGQGPATILRLANSVNAPVLVLGQTITPPTVTRRNIQVTDLLIDGNRLNQTVECWGGNCDASHPIRNNGITLRRVSDVLIARITIKSAISGGLVSEQVSRRITVRDFTSFDHQFDGLAAYQTENSLFSGLHLYSNLKAGLSFDRDFNKNIISNAIIADNGSVGIFLLDSRDNVFDGLQIRRSGEHGIFLAENEDTGGPAAGNTFTGIVIANSGVAPAPAPAGAGIRVNDSSCVNNLVVGSQLIANEAGGISEVTPGLVEVFGTRSADRLPDAATYEDTILTGATPAALPVEHLMAFEFVINRKTAEALGMTIPPALHMLADEVSQEAGTRTGPRTLLPRSL